jgi:hypothetical protein
MFIGFFVKWKIIFFPGHHSATLISEIVIIIVASYTDNRSSVKIALFNKAAGIRIYIVRDA